MPSKKKPIANCRLLSRVAPTQGWGEIADDSQTPDYGDAAWENDPSYVPRNFQRTARSIVAAPTQPAVPSQETEPRTVYRRHTRQEACTLILWVPQKLEYLAQKECGDLWTHFTSTILGAGKVQVTPRPEEDILRVLEVRSALGTRVQVFDGEGFFSGLKSMVCLLGKLRNEVRWISWIEPLRIWAMLTAGQSHYDPWVEVDQWFPPPSFLVTCETPSGEQIINYDEVTHAFTQGFQTAFKTWTPNPTSPDVHIILELEKQDMKVMLEVKPRSAIQSPFDPPFPPIRDMTVAHTLLTLAELQPGDVLLNCSCSLVDVAEEALGSCADLVHVMVCDGDPAAVEMSVDLAGQWSETSGADGNVCEITRLPYKENSIDVVIGFLHEDSTNSRRKQLQEMARVCRRQTGRVCFLTQQEIDVDGILSKRADWASLQKTTTAFHYFECTLYILRRSARAFQHAQSIACTSQSSVAGRRRRNTRMEVPPGLGFSPSQSPEMYSPAHFLAPPADEFLYADREGEDMDWTDLL